MKYLMTQSLLSAWLYMFDCTEERSGEAQKAFLATLNREKTEPSFEVLRGIAFEDAVQEYIKGDLSAPDDYAESYAKGQAITKEAEGVKTVANLVKGGIYQLTAYKDKRIDGIDFLLMAKCDWVRAGVIYDCKRVNNYEPGKYLHSPQHPMYLEVIDTARKFRYVVFDGDGVYLTDTYDRKEVEPIENTISQFINYLRSENLLEVYFEKWRARQ